MELHQVYLDSLKISDSTGEIKTKLISAGKISRDMFKTDDVFIFNSGIEIFVWVGAKATSEEKKSGMQFAMQYIAANNLPPTTSVIRILEGGENRAFSSLLD